MALNDGLKTIEITMSKGLKRLSKSFRTTQPKAEDGAIRNLSSEENKKLYDVLFTIKASLSVSVVQILMDRCQIELQNGCEGYVTGVACICTVGNATKFCIKVRSCPSI